MERGVQPGGQSSCRGDGHLEELGEHINSAEAIVVVHAAIIEVHPFGTRS
jgi:hypothetical protein